MNILELTSSFPRYEGDFSGNFIYKLAKKLGDNNIQVVVLCPHHPGSKMQEIMDRVKIYRFPYFYPLKYQNLYCKGGILYNFKRSNLAKIQVPLFFMSELFNTIKLIKKENIDIIHSHWLMPQSLIGAICGKLFNIPHVATVHGSDVNTIRKSKILRMLCNFIFHNSDIITTNSSYTKKMVLSINEDIEDIINIVPMGIDVDYFVNNKSDFKNELEGSSVILTVSRLIEWKGTEYLIIAMKEVVKVFSNSKLIVVGEGPEKSKLKNLVKDLDLEDHIIFTDFIEDNELLKYYYSASVFVLPTINLHGQTEGLGVVLLEAMACGTPVIGSNVGGIPDIIKNGYNGFLVPEKSPKDLSNMILKLLSNPSLASEFSHNGLDVINKKFSWDNVTNEFLTIYSHYSNF